MPPPDSTTPTPAPTPTPTPTPAPVSPSVTPSTSPQTTAQELDVTTTTSNTAQSIDPKNGTLNTESVTVESTPGGIRVKLPTLVLAHVLSLAGVCGGAYQLNKPDVDQTKSDIAAIAQRMERIERDRNAVVERLARIETLAENIREDLRDQRAYGRAAASNNRRQAQPQPVNPAEQ